MNKLLTLLYVTKLPSWRFWMPGPEHPDDNCSGLSHDTNLSYIYLLQTSFYFDDELLFVYILKFNLFSGFKHIFWSIIVCVAMGCAAIFLYSNTIDFMNATVVTTVDTMTVPLSEVFFPSVVVCNINQVPTNIALFVSTVQLYLTSSGHQKQTEMFNYFLYSCVQIIMDTEISVHYVNC